MKGPGILWMLQTAAGLSMAGPMFIIGVEFLRSGQYVFGVAFLTFGAIALYLPTYLVNQIGGPRTWIRRRLRSRGDTADDSQHPDDRSTDATDSVFDRFRNR